MVRKGCDVPRGCDTQQSVIWLVVSREGIRILNRVYHSTSKDVPAMSKDASATSKDASVTSKDTPTTSQGITHTSKDTPGVSRHA